MTDTSAISPPLDEYKSLRDETLKRVDARAQIISYTLAFAAAMFTLGLGTNGYASALLVYPIVAFFFAMGFSYHSMMLIFIGSYLRGLEGKIPGAGWATYLKTVYGPVELLELVSTAGLFVGTEAVGLLFYRSLDPAKQIGSPALVNVSWICFVLTILIALYPWVYHRFVLRRG